MKILILGGTGVISRAITDQLLARNDEVVLYNRGQRRLSFDPHVRQITGNRQDRTAFTTTLQKENFDVVIDMICFTEEDAHSTVETFKHRTGQIIICSSCSAYRRPYKTIPVQEDAEQLCDDPVFPYSYNKAQVERYLQKRIREDNLPITIIRPSLTFGPGSASVGVLRQNYGLIDRIRKEKPLVMFGDGTTPWSFTFAPDLAKAFVGAAGNTKTYGQHYHATNEERTIWKDLYLEFGKILGKEVKLFYLPSQVLLHAAPKFCAHLYYEKSYPGLFDNSKIRRDIPDFKPAISLNQGLQGLIKWFETEARQVDPDKVLFEDKLYEQHTNLMRQVENFYTK